MSEKTLNDLVLMNVLKQSSCSITIIILMSCSCPFRHDLVSHTVKHTFHKRSYLAFMIVGLTPTIICFVPFCTKLPKTILLTLLTCSGRLDLLITD